MPKVRREIRPSSSVSARRCSAKRCVSAAHLRRALVHLFTSSTPSSSRLPLKNWSRLAKRSLAGSPKERRRSAKMWHDCSHYRTHVHTLASVHYVAARRITTQSTTPPCFPPQAVAGHPLYQNRRFLDGIPYCLDQNLMEHDFSANTVQHASQGERMTVYTC